MVNMVFELIEVNMVFVFSYIIWLCICIKIKEVKLDFIVIFLSFF